MPYPQNPHVSLLLWHNRTSFLFSYGNSLTYDLWEHCHFNLGLVYCTSTYDFKHDFLLQEQTQPVTERK